MLCIKQTVQAEQAVEADNASEETLLQAQIRKSEETIMAIEA